MAHEVEGERLRVGRERVDEEEERGDGEGDGAEVDFAGPVDARGERVAAWGGDVGEVEGGAAAVDARAGAGGQAMAPR